LAALKTALLGALLAAAAPLRAEAPGRWAAEVAEASSQFGIPAEWIRRVMRIESGGRTARRGQPLVSPAGAMGLMQLMPGTWRDMRAMLRLGSDPFDPHDNVLAGTAYLRLMYDRFGYPGLFAAYNAGPGRYGAFLAGGRPLPQETRAYVRAAAPGRQPLPSRPFRGADSMFVVANGEAAQPAASSRLDSGGAAALFAELGPARPH
jgi:soluble lytic murein transglycosylase-like protein